jgi:glycosyltransferase involved in cell wall biosynthesis
VADRQTALWASTSTDTRGGVASYVRGMSNTPLWSTWNVRHVATHRDGSTLAKVAQFAVSVPIFVWHLVVGRPSVVHLHVASNGSFCRKFILSLLAQMFGVPVVAHVHGGYFHEFYANSPVVVQRAVRHLLGRSSAVVTLGATWADRLLSIEPGAAVHVIPNSARSNEAVGQPGAGEAVRVLFLGRIEKNKGTFDLIDAWQKMLAGHGEEPKPALTIVGDGDVEGARQLVHSLGLDETVDITGWVAPEDVPAIVRSAQILVLPSYFEGQPMAILEAMANGLCVIATNVGGIPDLIDDGCGILLPPGDVDRLAAALHDAVTDEQMRVRLGSAGLMRVREEFDVNVIWRRFDELYRKVGR